MPLSDDAVGEVDPEADDEDTEEEIEALVTEVEKALADMPPLADSPVVELAATMLLKVRGFIAKVCYKTYNIYFREHLSWSDQYAQVRRSPQAKKFFKKCCAEEAVKALELLPYCKTRWGSWHGVISRLLVLKKVCLSAQSAVIF